MHAAANILVCFGIRQVLGIDVADVAAAAAAVHQHFFADHSSALPKALNTANDIAWKALGVSLAGDGIFGKVKVWFASGDEKAFREQVKCFLDTKGVTFEGTSTEFREKCLTELTKAVRDKQLSAQHLSGTDITVAPADFRRYADPVAVVRDAEEAVAQIARALQPEFPNLAQLLGQPTGGGPPLLVAAFSYFFRREIEGKPELARGLTFDRLRQLAASQEAAFGAVENALATMGERFVEIIGLLVRIEDAVLDVKAELLRLGSKRTADMDELRRLFGDVMNRLDRAGMRPGEITAQNSLSIHGDDERRAVTALLDRFRQLPEELRKHLPALLNGLGKLQVGTGEFIAASQTFLLVSQAVGDPAGRAEALYNAYRAALEEKKWDEALQALRQAASLDPRRFAPFDFHQYEPKRILGAGGFGTAILCHDRNFDEDVVVKTLHAGDLALGLDDVFREARTLRQLSHPAIIGVQYCGYADAEKKARPYLVMNYFAGVSLEQFVQQRGTLSPEQLIAVAGKIAEGMKEAHARGILHRDLKPDNVLVRKEGDTWRVKIIDFGLAVRLEPSQAGEGASSAKSIVGQSMVGTMKYAPPEQRGEMPGIKPGQYSDVFAFGKLCCFALFRTTQPLWSNWKSLPPFLTELLNGCLQEGLEHRLKDFEQVLQALRPPIKMSDPAGFAVPELIKRGLKLTDLQSRRLTHLNPNGPVNGKFVVPRAVGQNAAAMAKLKELLPGDVNIEVISWKKAGQDW